MLWYFSDRHQPPPLLSIGHLQTFYFGVTPCPCATIHSFLPPPPINPPHSQQYHPPNTSYLKVYCDGSFQDGPHKAAYGVVIMNTEGIGAMDELAFSCVHRLSSRKLKPFLKL
ncbi:hypothetical protein LINPERHAP1_LOCUS30341 [Linum perenne]